MWEAGSYCISWKVYSSQAVVVIFCQFRKIEHEMSSFRIARKKVVFNITSGPCWLLEWEVHFALALIFMGVTKEAPTYRGAWEDNVLSFCLLSRCIWVIGAFCMEHHDFSRTRKSNANGTCLLHGLCLVVLLFTLCFAFANNDVVLVQTSIPLPP